MLLIAGSLGRLLTKRSGEGSALLGGVTAIFLIMTDDLGVGYSVFREVFPPALVSCLFVLAATQAFSLNPLAFVWLGIATPPP
eukprot:3702682-Prymnesium_polylepis.1